MKLLQIGNYLSKGYYIYLDNFFTTAYLANALYKLETFVIGTIRTNRKFLPQAFWNTFLIIKKYFRSVSSFDLDMWEKKSQRGPVLLLSTQQSRKL
jgi:hypothetical protein